jgi:voltage-gated potassium channel
MAAPDSPGASEDVGPFQLTLLVLSVVALGIIAAEALLPVPREVSRILAGVDLIACGVFFLDFVLRFRGAESKLRFLRWGWIDLLASIPNVDVLRLGRAVRVLRVLRLLRGVRSLRHLVGIMYRHKGRGGVATVVLIMFLLVVFTSVGILLCETAPDSNIRTAGDAVWWSVTTVTTVGYGDRFPVTAAGRTLAIFLMICGVGLFGTLSGVIASLFLGQPAPDPALMNEMRALREEIARSRGEPRT